MANFNFPKTNDNDVWAARVNEPGAQDRLTISSYMEAPRWAKGEAFLIDLARQCKVEYSRISEDKGLLRTFVRYKITGERWRLNYFQQAFIETAENWNRDDDEPKPAKRRGI